MTSKPDSVSTLGYHWTDHTGRPLEPQVHWDATGTTLSDASTQWCPSGDPVLICIIGTHWKATGRPLEARWLPTIISPVAFQCTLGSKFQAHWIATGLPLQDHWLSVRDTTWGRWGSIHASLKWQDGGTSNNKWGGLCKFGFYLEFTALLCVTGLRFKRVRNSTLFSACFGYEHKVYFLCIWGCSLFQTVFAMPVIYIRGCMLSSDLTCWPPRQILSVHWMVRLQSMTSCYLREWSW